MEKELEQMKLKQLMRTYFASAGRLLFWQPCDALRKLEEALMELLLKIWGEEERFETCFALLRETDRLQTVSDCAMMKLGGVMPEGLASYYDMKSDVLKYYDIQELQVFDMDILVLDNSQAIIDGEAGAMRLGACLNWLGLVAEPSADVAIRYWTVLAYTGDHFAMRALEFAYGQGGRTREADLWRTVREIFQEADRLFTITVPEQFMDTADPEAVDTAQVILAVRRRCADDGQELLPIPLLQYAIDSREDVTVKLQNLYAPPETYHTMLARQSHWAAKPLGFSV